MLKKNIIIITLILLFSIFLFCKPKEIYSDEFETLDNTNITQDTSNKKEISSYAPWFWILLAGGVCVGYLVKKKN